MALAYDTKFQTRGATALTLPLDINETAKLIVVGINNIDETSARAGGAPAWNTTETMTSVSPLVLGSAECAVEMWYLLGPTTGAHNVTIPNTGSEELRVIGSCYKGSLPAVFDQVITSNTTTASPMLTLSGLTSGAVAVQMFGSGYASVCGTGNRTLLYATDESAYNTASQYSILTSNGNIMFSFTQASDDVANILASWEEYEAPTPGTCALTGTVVSSPPTEEDIVTGGKTIILTLTDDTWVATVGADNAITNALISGFVSAGVEANGWNAVVQTNMVYTDISRDSNTQVTVTLGDEATYNITATESITVTIPNSAVTKNLGMTASPTFNVTAIAPPGPAYQLTGWIMG